MNRESLKYVLRQSTERDLPSVRPRAIELPLDPSKVVTLAGVRRAGKTFLMFDTIRRLLAAGVDRRAVLYLNLADDRLYPVTLPELDAILPAHAELYPETSEGVRYLFLDEVQDVPGWERFVRRVYDTENVRVFVTGSSSRLLTRDLAPALRGRSIGYEVFPLGFAEYASFCGLTLREYDRASEARLRHALEAYVQWGGMPELVLADEPLRPLILRDYAALLFYRDVVERYSVRNEHLMRLLLQWCAARPAALLSVHKLHRDLASQGVSASKNTLYEYLGHLEDAYLVFRIPRHEPSIRKREQNPKKVYLIDPALGRAFTAAPRRDRGAWLENLVFLHLRRSTRDLFYAANGSELDVVVPGADGVDFYDVTWSLEDPETAQRERASLAFGAERYPHGRGHLIAHDVGPEAGAREAYRFLLEAPPG
jgi:predicted AAA+ superfamily ATPase